MLIFIITYNLNCLNIEVDMFLPSLDELNKSAVEKSLVDLNDERIKKVRSPSKSPR